MPQSWYERLPALNGWFDAALPASSEARISKEIVSGALVSVSPPTVTEKTLKFPRVSRTVPDRPVLAKVYRNRTTSAAEGSSTPSTPAENEKVVGTPAQPWW